MKILMLETRRGSDDGFTIRSYEAGESYEVADTLARDFIRKGWATEEEERRSASEMLFEALKPPTREELERVLRPVPTNPATLIAKGEL